MDINQQQHIDKLLWQCAMGKQQQQQAAYPCHKPASHLPVLIEQLELSTSSKSSSRRGYASPFSGCIAFMSASAFICIAGTDAPLRAQSVVGNALAGLKLAYAQEISEDR